MEMEEQKQEVKFNLGQVQLLRPIVCGICHVAVKADSYVIEIQSENGSAVFHEGCIQQAFYRLPQTQVG